MSRLRSISRCISLCLLPLLLLSCQVRITPEQFPAVLLKKLDEVHSYHVSFSFSSAGQTVDMEQWYQAPDRVRTDVLEDGQPVFRFLYSGDRLQMVHLPTGMTQGISVTSGNELFVAPLLFQYCRQAGESSWERDSDTGMFTSSFVWASPDGRQRQVRLFIDPENFLPAEFELTFGDGEPVSIKLQEIDINPPLDESFFALTGK